MWKFNYQVLTKKEKIDEPKPTPQYLDTSGTDPQRFATPFEVERTGSAGVFTAAEAQRQKEKAEKK